jgi:hypothetical protein
MSPPGAARPERNLDEKVLGFSNRWYKPALDSTVLHELEPDMRVRVVTAVYFSATISKPRPLAKSGVLTSLRRLPTRPMSEMAMFQQLSLNWMVKSHEG